MTLYVYDDFYDDFYYEYEFDHEAKLMSYSTRDYEIFIFGLYFIFLVFLAYGFLTSSNYVINNSVETCTEATDSETESDSEEEETDSECETEQEEVTETESETEQEEVTETESEEIVVPENRRITRSLTKSIRNNISNSTLRSRFTVTISEPYDDMEIVNFGTERFRLD